MTFTLAEVAEESTTLMVVIRVGKGLIKGCVDTGDNISLHVDFCARWKRKSIFATGSLSVS